jgi:hypothetical protein
MVKGELVEYIRSSMAQGMPIEEIRGVLAGQGWSGYDIDEAIAFCTSQSPSVQSQPAPQPAVQGAAQQQQAVQGVPQKKSGPSIMQVVGKMITASDKQYTVYYLYKVIIEVSIFGAASLILILAGLPWYVPVVAIMIMIPVAVLQLNKVKKRSKSAAYGTLQA